MYLSHYLNAFIDVEDGELLISSDFGTTFNGNVKINSFDTPLWTGAVYLLNSHTVTPSKTLSECMTGWILRWQAYNVGEGVEQSNFQYTHIPKVTLQAGGRGHRLVLRRSGTMVTKRSEEHTSELQSRGHLVCRPLLEKKKKNRTP